MAEYLAQYVSPWIAYSVVGLVECGLLLALVMVSVAVFTWMERKVSARIQDRLGPTRVGGRFGWLQPLADGIKLFCKEDLIPAGADRMLFRAAPYISFVTMFAVFTALPWASGWAPIRLDAAVFFVIAVSGLEIFGVILGGYASGSKWSLYGSMREAAQVISYEIPMGLCVVVPVLIAGSMDLVTIGNDQSGWFWNWYLFHDPFTFVTFWIYMTCAVAHTNRAPFDLPEAESELVAGFMTEYSGFRWAAFFMAEYGAMLAISALAAILFLGGWNGPIPIAALLHLTPETGNAIAKLLHIEPDKGVIIVTTIANLLGLANMLIKAYAGVTFMMCLRWTLPRLRIDQVMTTCLKYCLPLVSAMLAGAMLWTFVFPGGVVRKIMPATAIKEPSPTVSAITDQSRTVSVRSIGDSSGPTRPGSEIYLHKEN
jgi:NADH-quinone oxidoreductase subunit H